MVTKSGSESDNAPLKTQFSSSTQWETGGENLVVYKNGSIIQKGLHYSILSTSQIQLASSAVDADQICMIITKFKSDEIDIASLDRSVKKLEGKTQTSLDKNVWEETISSPMIVHSNDVWASDIPETPANAVAAGTALLYDHLELIEDTTVAGKKGWYASNNGLITGRMSGWIPQKFGQGYTARLYDANNVEIPSSSPIGWKWDYASGYLFIENSHTFTTPFKIKAYVYTGEKIGQYGGSGSFWKPPMPTLSNLPLAGNTNGDIRLVLDENIIYRWDGTQTKWVRTTYGSQAFKDPVGTKSALPYVDNKDGDLRLVLDENGIYRWSDSTHSWMPVVTPHNHDGSYYLKSEIDSALAQKSNKQHTHNTLYYQKNEVDRMVRWRPPVANVASLPPYTENLDGDIILTLDTKTIYRFDYYGAPQGIWVPIVGAHLFWDAPVAKYIDLPATGNTVGVVRLVEEDSNTYWWTGTGWQKVTGLSEHNHDDLYYRKSEIKWKMPVNSLASMPMTDNSIGDVRLTLDTNNIYRWSGSSWVLISASPIWRESVDLLVNLPTLGNTEGDCRVVKETSCLYQWRETERKWVAVFNPDHRHDDFYYTKAQLDAGQLDNRYYTETEIDAKIKHHVHNGIDSDKVDYSDLDNIPYMHWKTPVVAVADLPTTGNTIGDCRIVLNDADLYTWNGALWKNVTGAEVAAHNHDDRYYTELEIDGLIDSLELWITSQLAQKSNVGHNHNDLYFTKAETESEIQKRFDIQLGHDHDGVNSKRISYYSLVDIPPPDAHDHDDRYYTKTNLQVSGESMVNWENVINKPDLANAHWKPPVQTKADLPVTGNTIDDIRLVLEDSDIYQWDGAEWIWIGHWENRYVDYWKPPVESYDVLPSLNNVNGDIRLVLDENTLYRWNQELGEWIVVFSSTYNLQVYLNGDLLMENLEYVRIKEKSIKLKIDVEGGCRLTIVITGESFMRRDFITYPGQKLFEVANRYKRYDWQANAGHTIFIMNSSYTIGGSQLLVWLNGDLLKAGDDFTERSPTSFQMMYPLNANDKVTAIILDQKSGDGEYIREDQYASAGQKLFNLTNFYPMGSKRLLVYYNGLLLKSVDDYTEVTNATIELVNRTSNANDHLTFIIFGANSGVGVTTGADILLGVCTDLTYQDGLLDLVPEMKMNDAIDDINEALLELAPDPAGTLTDKVLITEGLQLYSGYESAENINYETGPGVYHTYLTENHDFYIYTPDDCFSDADKGTIKLYLNGSVIDEFSLWNAFVEANADASQSAFTYGLQSSGARQNEGLQGSNGAIRDSENGFISIMSVEKHNNFKMWQRGKVRINVTISILRQGYNYFTILHETPDGSQISKPLKFFYDNANSRPSLEQDISCDEETLISQKYVSGIRYYSIGDQFRTSLSAYRIFQNTYNQIPLTLTLPGMRKLDVEYNHPDVTGPQNPPRTGDFFDFNGILTLDEFNEYSINARLHAETFDPFGAGEDGYSGSNNVLVNTFTNGSTDLIEYFRDEIFRLPTDNYDSVPSQRSHIWNSQDHLLNGNALLFDRKLKYANINFSGYRPAQTANYSGFTGPQTYYRAFYKKTPRNSGILTINGITLAELLTSKLLIDIKLPGQTGWLSLNKNYDVSVFTGSDGDGCLLISSDNTFTYSSGTFSTANSGFMVIVRITLPSASVSELTYMEMGGW